MRQQAAGNNNGGFEHVAVLLGHLKLEWLLRRFSPRLVWSLYVLVNGFITIALLAVLTRAAQFAPAQAKRPRWSRKARSFFRRLDQRLTSYFSRLLRKPPARGIPSWVMRLDSSAAMPHSPSLAPRTCPSACTQASTGQESSPPCFHSRPQVHSWSCCGPAIRPRSTSPMPNAKLIGTSQSSRRWRTNSAHISSDGIKDFFSRAIGTPGIHLG